MKNYYLTSLSRQRLLKQVLFVFCLLLSGFVNGFNGGTYTINPSLTASSVNYLSISSFVNDLRGVSRGDGGPANYLVGGAGVQASIVVNIAAGSGPYNQQISIPSILGMSATKTVTVNGNGATLSFTPFSTASASVLDMNGADFFTFNNLNIVNNATFGYCLWLRNAADFNVFRQCNFMCPTMTGFTTATAYIWISNGVTSPFSYANAANGNLFENNNLKTANANGPYYGIVMVGPTTSSLSNANSGNRFVRNNIQNWRYCGFYNSYSSNTELTDNTIHNTDYTVTSLKYGLYLNYVTGVFERNRLFNLDGSNVTANTQYPVYYYNFNNTTRPSTFVNNSIHCRTTGFNYNYIYNYATLLGAGLSILNNTFAHVSGTTLINNSTSYVVYGGYWSDFRNNLLSCNFQGSGTKYLYYDFSGSSPLAFTHNNFDLRASGNVNVGYVAGANRFSMNDMYAAGFATSNINEDPQFINMNAASDLHPTSFPMCNKGVRITTVQNDQRGTSRHSMRPDIGAIEYYLDLMVDRLYIPINSNVCSGLKANVRCRLRNNSNFPIRNARILTQLNNKIQVVSNVSSPINPGDTSLLIVPEDIVLGQSGSNVLMLYSNFSDDKQDNDTQKLQFNVIPAPGGAEFTFINASQGIFDYKNRGFSVNPFDEPFVLEMSAPRKYTMADYGTKWVNDVWVTTVSGNNLPNSAVVYDHNNNGRITFNAPKTYLDSTVNLYIKVTDLLTGCDTLYNRRLIIAPKGNPAYALPAVMCDGSEIYFENLSTTSSGQLTYLWDFGDNSSLDDAISPVHEFPSFGTYTIKLRTITSPYGFIRDSVFTVNINEVPSVKFKVANACFGSAVKMLNQTFIGNGTITYEWDMGDGKGLLTSAQPSYVYSKPGAYQVVLKAMSNGCVSEFVRNAYAFPMPKAGIMVKQTTYCQNEAIDFLNTSTLSYGTIGTIWDFRELGAISTDFNTKYMFQTPGVKAIKLKAISEFGCADSIEQIMNLKPAPVADFKSDFNCHLSDGKLLNTSDIPSGETATYKWDFGGALGNVSDQSPKVKWQLPGNRLIKLQVKLNNGCSDMMQKTITVNDEPEAKFFVTDKCSNEDVIFVNQSKWSQGDVNFHWDFGDGYTSQKANPVHAYNNTISNTYTVSLIANIVGACSDTFVGQVTVNPLPNSCDFKMERDYTNGLKHYKFMPKNYDAKLKYTWLFGDGTKTESMDSNINHAYAQNSKYCVTMIAQNEAGCECRQVKCLTIATDIDRDESLAAQLLLYPNPSTGIFNLVNQSEKTINHIQVFDAKGKMVMAVSDIKDSIDLSAFVDGIYFIEIAIEGQKHLKKVTVLK